MEEQIIKGLGSTTSGALVVTLLWFARAAYKKYAGRNQITVLKLVNGKYAAKIRRGIGFNRWVQFKCSRMTWEIKQCDDKQGAIDAANEALAKHGVSTADRISVNCVGFTEETPEL